VRQVVESRNLVCFVVSTALGLYLFRSWPCSRESSTPLLCAVYDPLRRIVDFVLICIYLCDAAGRANLGPRDSLPASSKASRSSSFCPTTTLR
jgi:hypothetical protein